MYQTDQINEHIDSLSPAKSALLETMLLKEGVPLGLRSTIPQRDRSGSLPLSFAQQRLWFLEQYQSNTPLYNVHKAYHVEGHLNMEVLQHALDAIVARHETLRTTFTLNNGHPNQVINEPRPVSIKMFDLTDESQETQKIKAQDLLKEAVRQPFDLSKDLMLSATVLKLDTKEYILVLAMHHIATDGWSIGILHRELSVLYEAFSEGKSSPLPELPIQYADFSSWQRDWLQGEALEKQLEYWRKQLEGIGPLDLPTDRPRSSIQSIKGAHYTHFLSKRLTQALKRFSQQESVTLFMTLLAVFKVLLHRYTHQTDIAVGTPIAGRTHTEIENLIGFFVNTLVLRTDLSGNPPFSAFLNQVRETTLNAYDHQDIPFEKLVQELKVERDPSGSPLFRVAFALQNMPRHQLTLQGLSLTSIDVDTATAKFDVTVHIMEENSGLRVMVKYNTDLFNTETINRMMKHYEHLLAAVVEYPEKQVSELPLLSEKEHHQLLIEWNNTGTDYPKDRCVHPLFEARVERTPDAVALVCGDRQLTYRQLNDQSNRLAHYLKNLGVRHASLVGVCLERSIEMIVGFLGILKAGGAYVPLDMSYPKVRLRFMVKDSQIAALITRRDLFAEKQLVFGSSASVKIVCVDRDWDAISRENETNPTMSGTAESLAYITYTSGSTGSPKGVVIPHRAITRLIVNTNYIQLDASDVIAQASNASFDAATFEIWGALLNGSRLEIIPPELLLSPSDFEMYIKQQGITVLFLTTALLNEFAQQNPSAFGSLRSLLFGGEAAKPRWIKEVQTKGAPSQLIHVYGPTENTTFTTWHPVRNTPEDATTIPIGRPVANTQLYVLDEHLNPLPVGVPGELYIGGDGLARGYLNRPELTAEKFIPNPFDKSSESRLYRSGDRVRYLPDGNIEFLGRLDHQVKIRGFRIELGEIEATLEQHPAVRECAVTVRENLNDSMQLVAYVKQNQNGTSIIELRRFLNERLPGYMVPGSFLNLEALPRTSTGKIDRIALSGLSTSRNDPEGAYVAPRTPTEKILAEIWAEVLGLDRVGIDDNFFELGGHSLLSIKLISHIEKDLRKRLRVASLFQLSTVRQLADSIDQEKFFEEHFQEKKGLSFHDYRQLLINVTGHKGRRLGPRSLIIEKQRGSNSKPPIFLTGGQLLGVTDILEKEQPNYFFPSAWFKWDDPKHFIKAVSTVYTEEILTISPQGPYVLGGYCHGGWTAYQTAQNLKRQGQEVALLVLVERYAPNDFVSYHFYSFLKKHSFGHLRNLSSLSLKGKIRYISNRIKSMAKRLFIKQIKPEAVPLSHNCKKGLIGEAVSKGLQSYVPEPYLGNVVIFLRQPEAVFDTFFHRLESVLDAFFHRLAWRRLIKGKINFYTFSGNHVSPKNDKKTQKIIGETLRKHLHGLQTNQPSFEVSTESYALGVAFQRKVDRHKK